MGLSYANNLPFSIEQIKSATGKRGTFEVNNPNTMFQLNADEQAFKDRYDNLTTEISKYRIGIKKFFDGKLSPN